MGSALNPKSGLGFALGFWGGVFVALPALVAWHDTRPDPSASAGVRRGTVPAAVRPPPVEPMDLRALSPETARQINEAVPFARVANPSARPFRFAGEGPDRARAVTCLAAAQYYEAGDDPAGQRAVAQVVLNRMRHPAFPRSVCAVVFQGAERSTGCQFTFTCDGALATRSPSPAAWDRARRLAGQMLSGAVDADVGTATHYHTDWVVPYWSASLDKVAAVRTHLFFRWEGFWGTRAAFTGRPGGMEPAIAALTRLEPAHALAGAFAAASSPVSVMTGGDARHLAAQVRQFVADRPRVPDGLSAGVRLIGRSDDGDAFLLELPARLSAMAYGDVARTFCSGRAKCRILGWSAGSGVVPAFPLNTAMLASMSFSYIHSADVNLQRMLWNCRFGRAPAGATCMKERMPVARSLPSARAGRPVAGGGRRDPVRNLSPGSIRS